MFFDRSIRFKDGRDKPILILHLTFSTGHIAVKTEVANHLLSLELVKAVRERLGISRTLAEARVDALDVSPLSQGARQGTGDGKFLVMASAFPKEAPAGANILYVAEIKEAAGLPVIGIGKLRNPMAAKSVEESFMDLVAVGRQMIADPD